MNENLPHDQQVNVRFQIGEMELIDTLRAALHVERRRIPSRSELIREAVREYVSRHAERLHLRLKE